QNGTPWNIWAKNGKTTQQDNQDVVLLWEDVKIQQAASDKNKENTMLTQSLTIYPKQHLAVTKDPVKATQPGMTITGIGMRAHLNTKQVELLSHVRGYYEKNQTS